MKSPVSRGRDEAANPVLDELITEITDKLQAGESEATRLSSCGIRRLDGRRKPVRRRTKPGTRRSARAANGGGSSSAGAKASEKPTGALGPCPFCGSDVIEQEKSYSCSGWRSGCKFAIWKTIAAKRISARTAQALLRRGTSPLLKGLKSKSGGSKMRV
jgi:hypothetical protein